nr:hypothetical protein [Tanacetum cinerariifolium]
MNPLTKNLVVPYPQFTTLIIDHILTIHPDIPKRLNEPNHLVAHDNVGHSIFASGNSKGQGMGIPDYLPTIEFMQTEAYKIYVADFKLVVPMTQPQPVASSQGTHRTHSAPRQPDREALIPTARQIDLDNMTEAQQLSYTLAKSAKEAGAQDNVKLVEKHLLDEDVNTIVEGDDSTDVEFANSVLLSQEDPGTLAGMSKRHGHMLQNMRKSFVHKSNVKALCMTIDKNLQTMVPVLVAQAPNQIFKDNLLWIELDIVEEFLRNYMNNTVLNVHPSSCYLIPEIQGNNWVPATADFHKMQLAYADMMRSRYSCYLFPRRQSGRSVDKIGRQYLIHEVYVKRVDDKANLFSESDVKYLNKNDIEDMVHDLQLGIESYLVKVNLTTPTITFHGIETLPLYSFIADPFVGIVYENSKKEKRDMNIDELQKFSDATLKRVVKKISVINVDA